MAYTGGKLNRLNGKYGISAPKNSVPVMKLIRAHQPRGRDELCELIRHHFLHDCKCGIKSQGTVEDFGRRLFEAQKSEWGKYPFSLRECIQWEYDLFVLQSLKGNRVEQLALEKLQQILPAVELSICEAEGYVDEELRVDLVISRKGNALCGIQVKPLTFNKVRQNVITFNQASNVKWGRPVFYLFYDENERFDNLEKVVLNVIELL